MKDGEQELDSMGFGFLLVGGLNCSDYLVLLRAFTTSCTSHERISCVDTDLFHAQTCAV